MDIVVAYKESVASDHLMLNAAHWPDVDLVGLFDIGLGEFPGDVGRSPPKGLEIICALFGEAEVCNLANFVVEKNIW